MLLGMIEIGHLIVRKRILVSVFGHFNIIAIFDYQYFICLARVLQYYKRCVLARSFL